MLRPRLIALGFSAAAVGSAAIGACSSDDPKAAAPDAGDEGVVLRRDTGAGDGEGVTDSSEPKPPPPVLPGCVGTAAALHVAGERAYVTIQVGSAAPPPVDAGDVDADAEAGTDAGSDAGASSGEYVVDYGTTGSTIDLAAFAKPPVPTYCAGDAAAPGADCTFQGFDFFGDWGQVWLRTADYSGIESLTRQAGILATDFLSLNPYTLDYTRQQIWRSEVNTFCTDAQLLGAGFMPLPTDGFFTNILSKLRPLSDVLKDPDAAVTTGFTVPNVPTVPITIAGVSALAQLDTGYDDRLIRHSINVNEALFAIIEQAQAQKQYKLTRDELADVYLTTCSGTQNEKVLAYRLQEGETFDFIASGGSVARSEKTIALFVKKRNEDTAKCGGIATWTVPAAQIGASFFVDAQALIVDPISSRVWIPKK
jgi:hypothetical protein